MPFFLMLYFKNASTFDVLNAAIEKTEVTQPKTRGDSLMMAQQAKAVNDTLTTVAIDTSKGTIKQGHQICRSY
jgi:hypothetical protein